MMYELKRIIKEMQNQYLGNKTPIELESACADYKRLAGEALKEAERLDKEERETPQEMRDVFAAAALIGIMATNARSHVKQAWDFSDAMIHERAQRIEARKAVQP